MSALSTSLFLNTSVILTLFHTLGNVFALNHVVEDFSLHLFVSSTHPSMPSTLVPLLSADFPSLRFLFCALKYAFTFLFLGSSVFFFFVRFVAVFQNCVVRHLRFIVSAILFVLLFFDVMISNFSSRIFGIIVFFLDDTMFDMLLIPIPLSSSNICCIFSYLFALFCP